MPTLSVVLIDVHPRLTMRPPRRRPHASNLLRVLRALPVAAILIAAAAPAARAQNASDQAVARSLFDEGAKLYAAGNYPEACAKLEASYHLFAGIGTRGKLAECYEKVGRTASAWAMYREVVALASKAGDTAREKVATDRAAALEPKLAHLDVVLPHESEVPGLVVKRGAETIERGAMGTSVPIDPGTITFEISAPGKITQTADVKVDPSASVTFTVPALEAVPAPGAGDRAAAPPGAASDAAGSTQAPPPPAWQRPTALIVGGAGVVAATIGGVLALTAKSSYNSAFSGGHCDHATLTCDSTGQLQTDGARTQANIGGVVFGLGLALVAGGGVLYFTAPHEEPAATAPTPPTTTAGVRVAPEVGPRFAGLTFAGGF
jgi:hypothetical protein